MGTGEQPGEISWLSYLLVLSLALNLGAIGTLAYFRRQEVGGGRGRPAGQSLTVKELCRSLPLQREQCRTLRGMMPEHRKQQQDLRGGLAREQRELWELLKQESPSWPEIQGKIKAISLLQTQAEEEAVRLCLEFQKQLHPQQKAVYLNLLERQLRLGREGTREPIASRGGRGWGGSTR